MVAQKKLKELTENDLDRIKKTIRNSYDYYKEMFEEYNRYRYFVLRSTLMSADKAYLDATAKPILEFNILEAFVNRLAGEFESYTPSFVINLDRPRQNDQQAIMHLQVFKAYLRHLNKVAVKRGVTARIFLQMLTGGFSVFKVYSKYKNERSMEQTVVNDVAYDPTYCIFDPLAVEPSKCDGKYCAEIFHMTKEDFEATYPNVDTTGMSFYGGSFDGINWAYHKDNIKIIIVAEYYEKKMMNKKLIQLSQPFPNSTQTTMLEEEYNKLFSYYEEHIDEAGMIQLPQIVASRMTKITKICRYKLINNEIIDYKETKYRNFPLIFASGFSEKLKSEGSEMKEYSKPLTYNARDIQRLKNFAGQSLANELENVAQQTILMPIEGLVKDEALVGYENQMSPSIRVYNSYHPDNPEKPLPKPEIIPRVNIPPEISSTFAAMDKMTQNVLGTYEASLGINDNQLSGEAIVQGATQSNAAAKPFINGYLQALNQVAIVDIEMLLIHLTDSAMIPGIDEQGQTSSYEANQSLFNYDISDLNVSVEGGLNFAIQKSRTLKILIGLMKVSPIYEKFFGSAEGMPFLLNNLDIKDIDEFKIAINNFLQKEQMNQQQAQQMEMQSNPLLMNAQTQRMKAMADIQKGQQDSKLQAADLTIKKQQADTQELIAVAKVNEGQTSQVLKQQEIDAENSRSAVELAVKVADSQRSAVEQPGSSPAP